jgi:hypothetical protein
MVDVTTGSDLLQGAQEVQPADVADHTHVKEAISWVCVRADTHASTEIGGVGNYYGCRGGLE